MTDKAKTDNTTPENTTTKAVCLTVFVSAELYAKLSDLLLTGTCACMSDLIRQILSDRIVDAEISGVIK